ncbi:cytochrome P450 72A397-like [Primulina huaijiensis]|uniref:cytochrome P450 72A397-like n=1 Tax=Primulina huaijiensis TaxID=1492673 RepID=UPI003CC78316
MILQEVLRLYPPVPVVARGSTQTVKLGNLTIPAGEHLKLLIAELHHDPEIRGDDAKEFKPQRFSKGISNAVTNSSSFVPFSWGSRIYIGQNFAMIEAKMVLAYKIGTWT